MAMKDLIKIGVIGLGERGMGLLQAVLIPMCKAENPDVQVLAVCDLYEDRAGSRRSIKEISAYRLCTTDYREVIKWGAGRNRDCVGTNPHSDSFTEAIARAWAVGLEVGGAYCRECWSPVRHSRAPAPPHAAGERVTAGDDGAEYGQKGVRRNRPLPGGYFDLRTVYGEEKPPLRLYHF